jgi:hypothetical protein
MLDTKKVSEVETHGCRYNSISENIAFGAE